MAPAFDYETEPRVSLAKMVREGVSLMSTKGTALDLDSSFKDILKEEFGTGVPQIATVVAVVIGSLGLQDYFNAGAWTVVAVLCFAAIFLYRRQLPSRLSRTTAWVASFLLISAFAGFEFFEHLSKADHPLDWLKQHPIAITIYFSFLSSVSLASLITSYRKQEKVLGLTYPARIEAAITKQLFSLDFYKEDVVFKIRAQDTNGDWVKFTTEMSYTVINRTQSEKQWQMEYKFNRDSGAVKEARFNEEDIEVTEPQYNLGTGIHVPKLIQPGKSAKVYFKVEEEFRLRDSELYTSYYPASELKLVVLNESSKIKFHFEVLHFSEPVQPKGQLKNQKILYLKSGLLPFQGVRMNWRPVDEQKRI
jgi:hypothetical protein